MIRLLRCFLCFSSIVLSVETVAAASVPAAALPPLSLDDFALQQPLAPTDEARTFQEGALYRVPLPPDILLGLQRTDLGDLAVFNAGGLPILRGLVRPDAQQRRTVHTITRLYPLWGAPDEKGESIRLSIDSSTDGRRTGPHLVLAPPPGKTLKGYIAVLPQSGLLLERLSIIWDKGDSDTVRLSLSSGDDLISWAPLGDGTLVRLDSGTDTLENNTLFPESRRSGAYLRLLFAPGSAPIAIRQIEAIESTLGDETLTFDNALTPRTVADTPFAIEYRLNDTAPGGLPITELIPENIAPGSYTRIRVLTRRDDTDTWHDQGLFTLFSVLRQQETLHSGSFSLNALITRDIRLERADRQPFTNPPTLRVRYRPVDLYFLAQGKPPYRLAWGSSRLATGPSPDIQNLIHLNGASTSLAWPDPAFSPTAHPSASALATPAPPSPVLWKTLILWGALGGGVLLLAIMAWRIARTMREK